MANDQTLLEKVALAILHVQETNKSAFPDNRDLAQAAIDTIRAEIAELDANQEQTGFKVAFDCVSLIDGEPFISTDVARRLFLAALAASPLGEKKDG